MGLVRVGWWAALIVAVLTVAWGLFMIGVGTACEHEYSSNCVYWGPLQGNGKGGIVINIGR